MGSLFNGNGDGRERDGGVQFDLANQSDLDSYRQAQTLLDRMRIPVLLDSGNPRARLYIAGLDGTGNSMVNDEPENWSVVGKLYQQVRDLKYQGITNIAGGYVEGTFTQEGALRAPERMADGRFAHSFDERVETAYFQFCKQAKVWLQEDPDAQIRIAGVGFSRGSEQVVALMRMIDERGIRDPDGARVVFDRDNVIQTIKYADRPLLVEPGRTLQASLLYDPVATGVENENRLIPGSGLSTFEISAIHERRDLFKDNDHVPPGFSEGMRNLNVRVAGSHSDVGDTYNRNGLGTLSFNLGVNFLNRLSDRPFLAERAVPDDPSQFVIHRSDQHMLGLYTTRGYDRDGQRDRLEDQHPAPGIQRKDPIRPELDAQVERRTAPAATPAPDRDDAVGALFDRLSRGALYGDDHAMSSAVGDYLRSPQGMQFQIEASGLRQSMDAQEQQAAVERQWAAQQQDAARAPHAMRM
jgi:hypothetical protein